MATPLQDVRTAFETYKTVFENYLKTEVYVWISEMLPTVGNVINPNEDFTIKIRVLNAATNSHNRMALRNVRYYLQTGNSSMGTLRVPSGPMVARSGALATDPDFEPGLLVKFMYLFPPDEQNTLDGGSGPLLELSGRAGPHAPATTAIRVRVLAEPDPDFVLSKHEHTPYASQELLIQPLND